MPTLIVLPMLGVLMLELVAFVKVIQKFRSPYAAAVAIVALFVVNILIYAAFIQLWMSHATESPDMTSSAPLAKP